jgi:hypothetical protein
MRRTFPIHGILGMIALVVSWTLHLEKVEPFYRWFYCFAWWSYILAIDGVIFYRKGNSLILNRTKEFLLLIPWSVFIWLIFEAANLSLQNWYYITLPVSTVERWLGYAVAYGTVLPGLFETTELLEAFGLFRHSRSRKIAPSTAAHVVLMILGIFCLASSVLSPYYFFPLIWVGFIFLLEPINYHWGGRSLLRDLEQGNPKKIYILLLGGLLCGLLWELWNFWAYSKWVYTVPFFEEAKGFEMPCLGFLGFLPFAIECYVTYNFISLYRFKRGWEESSYPVSLEEKTRRVTAILTTLFIISFSILIFQAIDLHTVDSYEVRLSDAYWIDPKIRADMPKVGIVNLDQLLLRTKSKKEREELALRLLVPNEELNRWLEKTELVRLKGLGIKNLRLLEGVNIHSITALASEDPNPLHEWMTYVYSEDSTPSKAKIRLWIREARRGVRR